MNTENKEKQEEKKNDEQSQAKFNNPDQKLKIFVIDTGKIKQTKAFARQDGTLLGIVWVASFVCTVVAKRLKYFRDVVREGHISFKHGLYYCVQTFFYATLLLTIIQYLWFRFMNTGMFMTQLQANYQMIAQAYQLTAEETKALFDAITMMKPIAWASMFMITDLIAGAVLSPILAAIYSKKRISQQ